eukprot:jgi/Bigna1/141381/aug1.62_g16089
MTVTSTLFENMMNQSIDQSFKLEMDVKARLRLHSEHSLSIPKEIEIVAKLQEKMCETSSCILRTMDRIQSLSEKMPKLSRDHIDVCIEGIQRRVFKHMCKFEQARDGVILHGKNVNEHCKSMQKNMEGMLALRHLLSRLSAFAEPVSFYQDKSTNDAWMTVSSPEQCQKRNISGTILQAFVSKEQELRGWNATIMNEGSGEVKILAALMTISENHRIKGIRVQTIMRILRGSTKESDPKEKVEGEQIDLQSSFMSLWYPDEGETINRSHVTWKFE